MKRFLKIIAIKCFLLLLFFSSDSFSQWTFIYPKPFLAPLEGQSLFFIDKDYGWCFGGLYAYSTTDGGFTWNSHELQYNQRYLKLFFTDRLNGWISGWNGMILHTTDGGKHWAQQANNLAYFIDNLTFFNPDTGWAVGYGEVLKTFDGGSNWSSLSFNDGCRPRRLFFLNEKLGWIGAESPYNSGQTSPALMRVYKTVNGGNSWQTYDIPNTLGVSIPPEVHEIIFADSLNGFITGVSQFLRTTDGGISWKLITNLPFGNYEAANSFFFENKDTGWLITSNGNLYKTINGGDSWFLAFKQSSSVYIKNFYMNGNTGLYITDDAIFRTGDGGKTWDAEKQSSFKDFKEVTFADRLHGILAVASSNNPPSNNYYLTNNGGIDWQPIDPNIFQPGYTQGLLWATDKFYWAGAMSTVYTGPGIPFSATRSTDFGRTWQPAESAIGKYSSVCFINDTLGWIAGYNAVSKTTDGGINWNNLGANFDFKTVNSVLFTSEKTGWIAGAGIRKSTDGGYTWSAPDLSYLTMKDINFSNDSTGWTITDDLLIKTTDGGKSWIGQQSIPENIKKIKFLNKKKGYFLTAKNLYITNDGGSKWTTAENIPTYNKNLNSMSLAKDSTIWICGDGGLLLRFRDTTHVVVDVDTTTKRDSLGIRDSLNADTLKHNIKPDKYFLSQNFPNPFNPTTTISYSIPKQSYVELKIYDLLGREVTTLVNKEQSAGEYKVQFDGFSLPSGIYIYSIHAGEYKANKKLLLLK